ncbi:MAG: hypothetical protein HN617_02250 [Planctomycetaceae bacterium]|jgi:hypothetical protein|nr:hypothetical protein [Planctomycetaceae bacterium]MBT4010712.1 hypothetical protein [Planctomycetaceae bacterium]MBT4724664.1 hypothetical protein [Planctomycetaceae bacterium]MBT5125182.1 hypothetical protein [Planctomycetaceae bacterium]MBT5599227.1 hypothetical protein [Planctomycetaceae bacterium]
MANPTIRQHWRSSLSLAVVILLMSAYCQADEFRAGAHTVDITPPIGIPMWGYGARSDDPSTGVLEPLEANALVIATGDAKLAFVGLDLGRAPTRKSMANIRRLIKEQTGIEHCFIAGSHTHHGPCLELGHLEGSAGEYVRSLEKKIAEAIIAANKQMVTARMGVGSDQVDMNRNRHTDIEPKPIDQELAVIRFDDMTGNPIALIVNYAAHPTSIDSDQLEYSPDYPGFLKKHVRKSLNCECLFMQGASGDLSTNRRGNDYRAFGTLLGQKVVEIAKSIETKTSKYPSIKVVEEDFQFKTPRINIRNFAIRFAFEQAFFPDLVDFYVDEYAQGIRPHLTVALINNELGLVGASGEFFCNHALRLKARSRLPHTIFLGYCNDYQQYFPTIEAAAEGGYGSDAMVSPSPIGAGEHITNRGLFHLYNLQNKFRLLRLK